MLHSALPDRIIEGFHTEKTLHFELYTIFIIQNCMDYDNYL